MHQSTAPFVGLLFILRVNREERFHVVMLWCIIVRFLTHPSALVLSTPRLQFESIIKTVFSALFFGFVPCSFAVFYELHGLSCSYGLFAYLTEDTGDELLLRLQRALVPHGKHTAR
jgi:hypothetical protein